MNFSISLLSILFYELMLLIIDNYRHRAYNIFMPEFCEDCPMRGFCQNEVYPISMTFIDRSLIRKRESPITVTQMIDSHNWDNRSDPFVDLHYPDTPSRINACLGPEVVSFRNKCTGEWCPAIEDGKFPYPYSRKHPKIDVFRKAFEETYGDGDIDQLLQDIESKQERGLFTYGMAATIGFLTVCGIGINLDNHDLILIGINGSMLSLLANLTQMVNRSNKSLKPRPIEPKSIDE